jgi:hypothetical protein
MALLRVKALHGILLAMALLPALAQDEDNVPEKPSKPPVALVFTPPDLDGRIVLGIFDAAGKLRRMLAFDGGSPDLKIDTNGYIAQWDGRDDAGNPCAAGRYSAHGYVVGEDVAVEGEAFHFNDWMAEDGIPALNVSLCEWSDGFGVELFTAAGKRVFGRISDEGEFSVALPPLDKGAFVRMDQKPWLASGREGTTWTITRFRSLPTVVEQIDRQGKVLRVLRPSKGEPVPQWILASPTQDAILLLESGLGMQRVRMLRRSSMTAQDEGGRAVADWEVVFERTLQPCAEFGLSDGKLVSRPPIEFPIRLSDDKLVSKLRAWSPPDSIELPLIENALSAVRQKLRLRAAAAKPGSALVSVDGLELVGISATGDWSRFALAGDGHNATLYQGNGVVVEEFNIRNLDHIAKFDAGSFLLAAPKE